MLLELLVVKKIKVKISIELKLFEINLQSYVSQILIPTEKVYQIKKWKKINKERSFFPGYVLIEADRR
jgi:transcriptional antiterminator NusG